MDLLPGYKVLIQSAARRSHTYADAAFVSTIVVAAPMNHQISCHSFHQYFFNAFVTVMAAV